MFSNPKSCFHSLNPCGFSISQKIYLPKTINNYWREKNAEKKLISVVVVVVVTAVVIIVNVVELSTFLRELSLIGQFENRVKHFPVSYVWQKLWISLCRAKMSKRPVTELRLRKVVVKTAVQTQNRPFNVFR